MSGIGEEKVRDIVIEIKGKVLVVVVVEVKEVLVVMEVVVVVEVGAIGDGVSVVSGGVEKVFAVGV